MIKVVWLLNYVCYTPNLWLRWKGENAVRPTVGLMYRNFRTHYMRWEGTPFPCDFLMGVHGVCLTKVFILYHDLQNYYFLIYYACENIEKFFMIIHFFYKFTRLKKTSY